MLPGVGHSPMLEDPARTASCLLAFTATKTEEELKENQAPVGR
jgi:hypothetical protein